MIDALKEILKEQGITDLEDKKKSYGTHIISGKIHNKELLLIETDEWLSRLRLSYGNKNTGYRISEMKSALLSFVANEWQIPDEDFNWESEKINSSLARETLHSEYWSVRSYIRARVAVNNLKERQEEYDEKYADYSGWKTSGYNKYYSYRSTARLFLAKHATKKDLLFMKAIIDESLENEQEDPIQKQKRINELKELGLLD